MFDVGFWELVVIFGLGLMVLGPERMPRVAARVGRWAGQARRMARNLTEQFRAEMEPIENSIQSVDQAMRKDYSRMRPDVGQTDAGVTQPADSAAVSAQPGTAESAASPYAAGTNPDDLDTSPEAMHARERELAGDTPDKQGPADKS